MRFKFVTAAKYIKTNSVLFLPSCSLLHTSGNFMPPFNISLLANVPVYSVNASW